MDNVRILLVEDDTTLSDTLSEHFTKAGYEVTVSKTAEDAWPKIERTHPSLVITDVTLPGMDGLALATKITTTSSTASIPIIVLTNNDDGDHLADAIGAGVTTYLLKSDHTLASIVDAVQTRLHPQHS